MLSRSNSGPENCSRAGRTNTKKKPSAHNIKILLHPEVAHCCFSIEAAIGGRRRFA